MARRKNPATARPPAARSAAHAAPAPDPAPGTGPAPDSPAGAVYAALAAHPGGATTAVIADAIGIGRAAARDALTELETAGTVTRTKGGKPGIPDTWTLTAPGPPAASSQPGDDPATGRPATAPPRTSSGGAGQQEASDGQRRGDPGTGAAQAAVPDGEPRGDPEPLGHPEQAAASRRRHRAEARRQPGLPTAARPPASRRTRRWSRRSPGASSRSRPPPPPPRSCWPAADLRAALAGMDEIYEQAAQARRALKAAAGGRKAPAARPGGLREKVLAHLRDQPRQPVHPARDPQGARPLLRGHRQRPGHPGQARRRRAGHRKAPQVPPRRQRRHAPPGPAPAEPGARSGRGRATELAGAA